MQLLGWQIGRVARPAEAAAEARSGQLVSTANPEFMQLLGLDSLYGSASGISVTTESALSVPAIFGAVNFIAGTMAGLPLNLFERDGDTRHRLSDTPLAVLLHDAVNDQLSSFEWRKHKFEQVLTGGRGFSFIERNAAGTVMNIWPLDPGGVTVKRDATGRKSYEYRQTGTAMQVYQANEIIDIPFMLKPNGLAHRGPITTNRDVIGLAIAATQFGSKYFQNGGVPPFAVTGNFTSGEAMGRAATDLSDAVRRAAKDQRQALMLPSGLTIAPLGVDAAKSQLVELKQFLVEEFARIYSLPPVFLQDLSHGTFSNTEQQDLHLVKHTIKRWVEAFEQELNLKLFGRTDRRFFVEMNMDGLLRGDFKTRMDGYAAAVQNGLMTPNEVRRMENRPDDPDGNALMIQGATVPIRNQLGQPGQTGASNGA